MNEKKIDCSRTSLYHYLGIQAGQDVRKKMTACYIYSEEDSNEVMGYYTLSNHSIPSLQIPEDLRKKMLYPDIPVTLLGRLAIDKNHQGKGIGKILLLDALKKYFHATKAIGSYAVVVNPIDENEETFYGKWEI